MVLDNFGLSVSLLSASAADFVHSSAPLTPLLHFLSLSLSLPPFSLSMLSSLSASLLPASVADLFDPPLDAHQLAVSLTTGSIKIEQARLNTSKVNEIILTPPAAPIRLLKGSLQCLELSVNWKALLSQVSHSLLAAATAELPIELVTHCCSVCIVCCASLCC